MLLVLPGLGLPRLTLNLGASIVLFGLAATGLNLMLGYVGMLSLGGALYLGASGYIVALTTQPWGWPMLGALLAADRRQPAARADARRRPRRPFRALLRGRQPRPRDRA